MEDLISLVFIGIFVTLGVVEAVRPARTQSKIRLWRLKGLGFFAVFFVLSGALPLLWDEWMGAHRLIDATGLGTLGGSVLGLLGLQLVNYTWHRTMHRVPLLWRWFHQMHHSAERVDVAGAVYFHPLDMIGFTFMGSVALVLLFGVSGEAALIANVISFFCAIFQHTNIRTPRWLGYIIHRPESHSIHHQRGVHAGNYGDIALWDMVFGTFVNPEDFAPAAGFYDGASSRMSEMLMGRDVSEAPVDAPPSSASPVGQAV